MNIIDKLTSELHSFACLERVEIQKKFFKTNKGEYGDGDVFLGITVPQVRKIAKKYWRDINLNDLTYFLHSLNHEERALALFILIEKFEKSKDKQELEKIVNFYLTPNNLKWVNNWDLVDLSCYKILGKYLLEHQDKVKILDDFAVSENLWIKRIAIITTFAFIKNKQFEHTIRICNFLLNDKHDLIHKAIGWMLREIGKRDRQVLLNFLDKNHIKMARVSVRYAIEKFTNEDKIKYKKLT